jgi:hypothetical protein
VGGFAYDCVADRWAWSAEVYRIHGFEPHDVVPTTELIRYHLHPDDRDRVMDALWHALESQGVFTVHCRIVDAHGTLRTVVVLGTGAGGQRLRGQVLDLSWLHDEIVHHDVAPVVEDFVTHRAVIEQAKGVVVQLLSVDADEAFDRMRRYSQHANVKVRDLAVCLVAAAAQDRTPAKGRPPGLDLAELFALLSDDAPVGPAREP